MALHTLLYSDDRGEQLSIGLSASTGFAVRIILLLLSLFSARYDEIALHWRLGSSESGCTYAVVNAF